MPSEATENFPLYKGSCHCAFIQYTVKLYLHAPSPGKSFTLTKCNCTYCLKTGCMLAVPVKDSFTLLRPSQGHAALGQHVFGSRTVAHPFCPRCGVLTHMGFAKDHEVARVNVLTLDGTMNGEPMDDLRDVKIMYWDGRTKMGNRLGDEPFEGGVW